jgi:hypothetical protein
MRREEGGKEGSFATVACAFPHAEAERVHSLKKLLSAGISRIPSTVYGRAERLRCPPLPTDLRPERHRTDITREMGRGKRSQHDGADLIVCEGWAGRECGLDRMGRTSG